MSYTKRHDGRALDETRPIEAKAGVIARADGSAFFRMGNTSAYAAVYGPRELHPRFMQDPKKGLLRCIYNMMPFSGMGERVRPGPSRRSKEISMVTTKALEPVVNLSDYPYAVVDVYVELTETDAGSRCAGICAASIALADAGIQMKDMVAAVSVGHVGGTTLVDLDYKEEQYEDEKGNKPPRADIPLAMIPSTEEFTLLQMDGEISKEHLYEAVKMGIPVLRRIAEIQRAALKEKYAGEAP